MTTQKPQPRILTFTKPDNIRGSVHGKITAYQELWNYVEILRYTNHNHEKNINIYKYLYVKVIRNRRFRFRSSHLN